MSYIYQQLNYNDSLSFGPTEGEVISQSFVFGRSFQLNAVNLRFGHITISPAEDLQFRLEVRRTYSSDELLNLNDDLIRFSSWVTDDELASDSYVSFQFDRTTLESGTYYFSLVSNIRIRYPIYVSVQTSGTYRGKFIKYESGTGIYREDWSLAIKIDGVWGAAPRPITVYERNIYTETTIRDGS